MPGISKIQWSESPEFCLHYLLTDRYSQPTDTYFYGLTTLPLHIYSFYSLRHEYEFLKLKNRQPREKHSLLKDQEEKEQQVNQNTQQTRQAYPDFCSSKILIPQAGEQPLMGSDSGTQVLLPSSWCFGLQAGVEIIAQVSPGQKTCPAT